MRHFAVHLPSRERESRLSTSRNRMIQRWTRMSLCAGNRHSTNEQTRASLSFHTRRFFEAFRDILSIDIKEEKRRVATRESQSSLPLSVPRSPSRNYYQIPQNKRDAREKGQMRFGEKWKKKKAKTGERPARKRWRGVGKGRGREKRREYDFDRGKVEALDREASREGGTIGSSPCRSDWGKRDSFSPVRDSAFSVERVLLLLYHVYNLTPYFIFRHFPESKENLTNGFLSTYDARGKSQRNFNTRHTSLSILGEILAHICRINVESVCSIYAH